MTLRYTTRNRLNFTYHSLTLNIITITEHLTQKKKQKNPTTYKLMAIHQLFKKKFYFLKIIKYLYQIITIKFGNFVFFLNIDKKNLYNQISIKIF